MVIRKAKQQDSSSICEISCKELGYECSSDLVLNRLNNLNKNNETVFVAQVHDIVVGFIHAEIYKLLYQESMVNILGLAVLSEHQRKGIGKALLKQVETWSKELGIHIIRLNSGAARTEAHKFYRITGFENEKKQIRFIKHLR